MVFRQLIAQLLAIFVIVGLAVAPMVAPAAGRTSAAAGMTEMSSTAADLPCCPDEQKSKTCTDCPLVAMCVLTTAQAAPPETLALPVRHAVRTAHAVLDEATADGLAPSPPHQPPRNLV